MSKRFHGSPETRAEKPGKRRCCDVSTSNISGVTSPPASEADHQESPFPDNNALSHIGSHSAAHPDHLGPNAVLHDQANHDNQNATENGNSQSLILIEKPSVYDQQDTLAGTTSAPLNVRAVSELLTDWPSYSAGLTEGICDLRTLNRLMASDDLSDDHRAMWVSLVQTIVYEPDQKSVLAWLQNLLSGNSEISDRLLKPSYAIKHGSISVERWAVTGLILRYADRERKWSAAHFVDLALWVGGPHAGIQAARALKVFGVWNPSGSFTRAFSVRSISSCLDPQTILRRIWPDEIDGEELIEWANHRLASTDYTFTEFRDAHSYLLRQCIGEDLTLFSRLSRNAVTPGDANNRIISRAYFDSTLAPLLKEHFDADVNFDLAYSAAVVSQGRLIDRNPVDHTRPSIVRQRPAVKFPTFVRPKEVDVHQADDHQDDSEHFPRRVKLEFPNNRWTPEETDVCLAIIRQIFGEKGDNVPHLPFRHISKRLKAEHNIDRTEKSIGNKWRGDWRHRPEFQNVRLGNDNDENFEINKKNKGRQKTYGSGDEAEDFANHPATVPEGDVSDDSATDATDQRAVVRLPPPDENGTRQVPGARKSYHMTPYINNSMTTRNMSKIVTMDRRTINDLYQQSRHISSDVISQFIEHTRPRFLSFWKGILEHRKKYGMETLGSNDKPPFPPDQVPDYTPVPKRLFGTLISAVQEHLDSDLVKDIGMEVRELKAFAESPLVRAQAQPPRPADGPV